MSAGEDAGIGMPGFMLLFIGGAVGLVVLTVIGLLGLAVVGPMVDNIDTDTGEQVAHPNPVVGESVSFQYVGTGESITNTTVRDSRGFAVELTGSNDSYVAADGEIEWRADDTWTVSTAAAVDQNATSETMAVLELDGEIVLSYHGDRSEWMAWYYDAANRTSWTANVSAPSPTNLTTVIAAHNGTHLTIRQNTTDGETVDTTGSNTDPAPNTTNWHGTLEETRTFDDALSDANQTQLHNQPIEQLPGTNRTARLMYDEGAGTSTYIAVADASATVSNGSWVDGYDGNELVAGQDYQLDNQDGDITALDGGAIDGAPVVWLDYEFESSRASDLGDSIGDGFTLIAQSSVIIPAVVILSALFGLVALVAQRGSGSVSVRSRRRRRR